MRSKTYLYYTTSSEQKNGKEYHQFRKMKRLSPHYPRQVYWAVLIHTASGKNITLLSKIFFYINTNLSLYQTLKLYFSEALVHSIPLDLARDSSGGKKRKEKQINNQREKNSKFKIQQLQRKPQDTIVWNIVLLFIMIVKPSVAHHACRTTPLPICCCSRVDNAAANQHCTKRQLCAQRRQ